MMIFMFLLIRALCHLLLRRRWHTYAISDLYGVINVHFKETRVTLLIRTELLNTLMIGHLAVMITFSMN
jgi:hypothetical protein